MKIATNFNPFINMPQIFADLKSTITEYSLIKMNTE